MCEDQTMIICTLMGYIIQSHLQNVKQMNCSKQEAEYNIANTNAAYRRAEISNMQEISREKNAKIKRYSRYLLHKPHNEQRCMTTKRRYEHSHPMTYYKCFHEMLAQSSVYNKQYLICKPHNIPGYFTYSSRSTDLESVDTMYLPLYWPRPADPL